MNEKKAKELLGEETYDAIKKDLEKWRDVSPDQRLKKLASKYGELPFGPVAEILFATPSPK